MTLPKLLLRLAPFVLVTVVSACASPAVLLKGGDSSDGGSITTTAASRAQPTQIANNDSLPLSAQNTPDAIAARDANARAGISTPAVPTARTTGSPRPAASAAINRSASDAAHEKAAGFAKGATVQLRGGAALYERPTSSSGTVLLVPTTSPVELGAQIYNAGGYWYYVAVGKDTGWVSQADLLP